MEVMMEMIMVKMSIAIERFKTFLTSSADLSQKIKIDNIKIAR